MTRKDSRIEEVERSVLSVYKRVDPSTILIEDDVVYNKWRKGRELLFTEKLKILPAAFRRASLLEIGGGTGENTVLYCQWGADVTVVDPNDLALERARFLWKKFGCVSARAIQASLFDLGDVNLPLSGYEFVFCEGVLHHTADPIKALKTLLPYVKPQGLLMIAFAEEFGIKARQLQRSFIRTIAGDNEEKIVEVAKRYFQKHLDRCVRYGGRSELSVIYDSYVNPQVRPVNITEVLDVLHANRFRYYSGAPELNFPYATARYNQPGIDYYDAHFNRTWIEHLQRNWLICGRESDEQKFAGGRPEDLKEYDRFVQLERGLRAGGDATGLLTIIQEGYLGIGLHYLVSIKAADNK